VPTLLLPMPRQSSHSHHISQRKPLQIFSPTLLEQITLLFGHVCKRENNRSVVFFLLSDSPVPEFYMPIFRNALSVVTPPMKMELAECSETMAYKIQTAGNHPKERIQHSEQGESLKSRRDLFFKFSSKIFLVLHIFVPRTSGHIIFH